MLGQAIQFEMCAGEGSQPSINEGKLYMARTKSQHKIRQDGWRAVISFSGKRKFGSWRSTIVEAIDLVLRQLSHMISDSEKRRIIKVAATWQARQGANLATRDTGSQPRGESEHVPLAVELAHSQAHERKPCVSYVHQMYGLYGDEKPMSNLFETSRRMWSDVAAGMGAMYYLWSAAEVEALMKQRYPQHWDMYCDVRYPIMRCDIGRIAILHSYGGLYADLDTHPNRAWYAQAELALQRVHYCKSDSASATRLSAKRLSAKSEQTRLSAKSEQTVLDMEVIIGSAGNRVFMDWLNYIRNQIAGKPYADKSSFWYAAKMRYVFNTTGPYSMNRFLKLPSNATALRNLRWLECNHFKETELVIDNRKRLYDVISFISQSYFSKEHSIHVPVGRGDAVLPALPTAKRLRVRLTAKTQARRVSVSDDINGDATVLQVTHGTEAHSQDASPSQVDEAVAADDWLSRVDSTLDWITDLVADLLLDSMTTAVWNTRLEARTNSEERRRMNQMKLHFKAAKNCVSVKTVMDDMPRELREWVITSWGSDDS